MVPPLCEDELTTLVTASLNFTDDDDPVPPLLPHAASARAAQAATPASPVVVRLLMGMNSSRRYWRHGPSRAWVSPGASGVEGIPQAVAEQVEGHDGDEDRQA